MTGYEIRLPLIVGQKLTATIHFSNDGTPLKVVASSTMDFLPDIQTYTMRKAYEEALWQKVLAKVQSNTQFLAIPSGDTILPIESPMKSDEDALTKLKNGYVHYFVTVIQDERKKTIIESCIHTDPKSNGYIFCVEHNR